jgi:hypothetical protein
VGVQSIAVAEEGLDTAVEERGRGIVVDGSVEVDILLELDVDLQVEGDMEVEEGMQRLDTVVEPERVDRVGIVVGIALDRRWEMGLGGSLVVVDTDMDNVLLSQVVHPLDRIPDYAAVIQILSPSPLPLPFHLYHLVPREHSHQTLHLRSYSATAAADSPDFPQSQHYSHSAYHSSD